MQQAYAYMCQLDDILVGNSKSQVSQFEESASLQTNKLDLKKAVILILVKLTIHKHLCVT